MPQMPDDSVPVTMKVDFSLEDLNKILIAHVVSRYSALDAMIEWDADFIWRLPGGELDGVEIVFTPA